MVAPSTGSVVLVPFSDLSQAKLRPAVALASGDRNDWVLCQVICDRFRLWQQNDSASPRHSGALYEGGF